jgi:hypothetical protein
MAQTKTEKAAPQESRRNFLKLATAAAPAAIAATALSGTAAVAGQAAPTSGLQDTEHTRAYFASARF